MFLVRSWDPAVPGFIILLWPLESHLTQHKQGCHQKAQSVEGVLQESSVVRVKIPECLSQKSRVWLKLEHLFIFRTTQLDSKHGSQLKHFWPTVRKTACPEHSAAKLKTGCFVHFCLFTPGWTFWDEWDTHNLSPKCLKGFLDALGQLSICVVIVVINYCFKYYHILSESVTRGQSTTQSHGSLQSDPRHAPPSSPPPEHPKEFAKCLLYRSFWERVQRTNRTGDIAQSAEHLPNIHEAQGFMPSAS